MYILRDINYHQKQPFPQRVVNFFLRDLKSIKPLLREILFYRMFRATLY